MHKVYGHSVDRGSWNLSSLHQDLFIYYMSSLGSKGSVSCRQTWTSATTFGNPLRLQLIMKTYQFVNFSTQFSPFGYIYLGFIPPNLIAHNTFELFSFVHGDWSPPPCDFRQHGSCYSLKSQRKSVSQKSPTETTLVDRQLQGGCRASTNI